MRQTKPVSKQGVRNLAGSQEEVQLASSGGIKDEGRFKEASKDSPWKAPKVSKSDVEQQPKLWMPRTLGRR